MDKRLCALVSNLIGVETHTPNPPVLHSVGNGLGSTWSNVAVVEPNPLQSIIDIEERSYDYCSIVAKPAATESQPLEFTAHQLLSLLFLVVLRQQLHEVAF